MPDTTFCNQCGHRNPPESNFCSSCGAPLDSLDDRTVTISAVDPLQDSSNTDDDIVVPVGDLERGVGVLIVRAGSQAGTRFPITDGLTELGRHPASALR